MFIINSAISSVMRMYECGCMQCMDVFSRLLHKYGGRQSNRVKSDAIFILKLDWKLQ